MKVQTLQHNIPKIVDTKNSFYTLIHSNLTELSTIFTYLQLNSITRQSQLLASENLQKFLKEQRNLTSWILSHQGLVSLSELPIDSDSLEALIQRHSDLKTDIEVKKETKTFVEIFGSSLISDNHYAKNLINAKYVHI